MNWVLQKICCSLTPTPVIPAKRNTSQWMPPRQSETGRRVLTSHVRMWRDGVISICSVVFISSLRERRNVKEGAWGCWSCNTPRNMKIRSKEWRDEHSRSDRRSVSGNIMMVALWFPRTENGIKISVTAVSQYTHVCMQTNKHRHIHKCIYR